VRALAVCVCWAASLLSQPGIAATQLPDPELKILLQEAISRSESFDDHFDATVWMTDMSTRLAKRVPDPAERLEILATVHLEARRADLPPELVLAVIDIESAFDRWAISVAGARGLMQVMPFWLEEMNRTDDNLFEIKTNVVMGCTILRYYLDVEGGGLRKDLQRALARYNGSVGKTWYSEKVMSRLNSKWFRQ